MVTVLELHQFHLEIGSIQVKEHLFVTVEFEVVWVRLDVEFGFVSRLVLLTRGHHQADGEED
jgi:uncharacterized membrane protein YGL010W